jgi:hypothetical protein
MISEDKKIEILLSLSETLRNSYDTRRTYEWKVSFGLWTAIGIIAGFALKEDFSVPFNKWWGILFLGLILIGYLIFHYGLEKSNTHDQKKRHIYINKFIHADIGFDNGILSYEERKIFEERPKTSRSYFLFTWSHGSQTLITTAFLLILGFILLN